MGIQSFTPTAGGSPDRKFIATTALTTTARDWSINGSAGHYSIMSATNQAGYAIFTDGTNKTGVPIGKTVNVVHSFNSISIMGLEADQFTLYKVSPKSTANVSDIFGRFNISYTRITTSGNHAFPGTYLPVVDLLLVGAGGSGGYHGGGGGGGGAVVYYSKFPMVAITPATIGVGGNGSNQTAGGNTTFGGVSAIGGGGGGHYDTNGGAGGNGGGAGGHHNRSGGGGIAQTGLAYGFTYAGSHAGQQLGHNNGGNTSGSNNNWQLRGGGGGGAGGAGQTGNMQANGNGGPGVISPLQSFSTHTAPTNIATEYFSAGGPGADHNSGGHGSYGTGWSASGYGNGGKSTGNSHEGGTQGCILYRSYS